MFTPCCEPGAANEAVTYGGRPEPASQSADLARQSESLTGIDLRALPAGTAIVVDTRHSRYRFIMLDGSGRNALVEGGAYFPQETAAHVEGSTLGGSLLQIGWIGLGLFLELSFGRQRIITSRVRSISVPKEIMTSMAVDCDRVDESVSIVHPVVLADCVRRIRAEYLDLPGLSLTARQAQRLWNVDSATCQSALGMMVRETFLRRTPQGHYVRADCCRSYDSWES